MFFFFDEDESHRIDTPVGDKIKKARIDRRYTQASLANKAGVSRSQLAQWETDKRRPLSDNLQKLATALDLSIDDLLHYGDNRTEAGETEEIAENRSENYASNDDDVRKLYYLTIEHGLNLLSLKGLDEAVTLITDLVAKGGDYLITTNNDNEKG